MILTAALTPALQQILVFDAFTPGAVNRARQVHWCASGKVLNAARAVHLLGGPRKALTLVGGLAGEAAIQSDFAQLGIAARWLTTSTPTRVCTTILDTARHTATELVPEAQPCTDADLDAFKTAFKEETAAVTVVVLIGSLPPGTPIAFYRELIEHSQGKVILDARGPELLEALPARPFLIKPNREEVQRTLGRELHSDEELLAAMQEFNRRGAAWVVVTSGKDPILVSTLTKRYLIQPPSADVVNAIGCGDCMAAGIAWATFQGHEPLEAIRYGVAAATDKLGRLLPAALDARRVAALVRNVAVNSL